WSSDVCSSDLWPSLEKQGAVANRNLCRTCCGHCDRVSTLSVARGRTAQRGFFLSQIYSNVFHVCALAWRVGLLRLGATALFGAHQGIPTCSAARQAFAFLAHYNSMDFSELR